jgi:hypothetical protein
MSVGFQKQWDQTENVTVFQSGLAFDKSVLRAYRTYDILVCNAL